MAPKYESVYTGDANASKGNVAVNQTAFYTDHSSAASTRTNTELNRRIGLVKGLPAAIALILLPVIGFVIWLPIAYRHGGKFSLESIAIGGNLTQVQAKVIDVMCSAVFGPIIVFSISWHWFSTARVTVFNERSSKSVNLSSLVEMSKTETGSYNPYKLFRLVRSGKPKMIMLAALVLLAALSASSLANVIAYEAFFPVDTKHSTITLHSLNPFGSPTGTQSLTAYNFTNEQKATFSGQAIGTLTEITYQNASAKLDQGMYIGINATQASLSALEANISTLYDVPGYRLNSECKASAPTNTIMLQMGGFKTQFNAMFGDYMYTGAYPGQIDALQQGYNDEFAFISFFPNATKSYLFFMSSGVSPDNGTDTPFGPMVTLNQNMTLNGFTGTQANQTIWGFECTVFREVGLHRLLRNPDLSWRIENSTWSGEKSIASLLLADTQLDLNFHNPTSPGSEPGIAPAFRSSARPCTDDPPPLDISMCSSATHDYQINIDNFLYAAASIERVAYEIKNTAPSPNAADIGPFPVQATKSSLRYRMTYVPAILFIGLTCLLAAACVSLALAVPHHNTMSYRNWRDVDVLRLLTDAAVGLEHEVRGGVGRTDGIVANETIAGWADGMRVRYVDDAGRVRLVPVEKQ